MCLFTTFLGMKKNLILWAQKKCIWESRFKNKQRSTQVQVRFVIFFPHHLEYSDYCHLNCYTHNILANMSFGLLQVFHVELRSLQWTLNRTLYLIWGWGWLFNSVNHYQVYFTCSWDWTCNLQMISLSIFWPNVLSTVPCVQWIRCWNTWRLKDILGETLWI